jgi:hypothetical protein
MRILGCRCDEKYLEIFELETIAGFIWFESNLDEILNKFVRR